MDIRLTAANNLVRADWTPRLADALAGAIREIAPRLGGEPVVMLAVDCHPWDRTLGLSLLTRAEAAADALLADPAEVAAWRWFDFARDLTAWGPAAALGDEMRAAYEADDSDVASSDRPAVAAAFLRACAAALQSAQVGDALARLTRADGFRLSAAHPDDGREFVTLPD